jgi:O-antigen/teichoic acid export membrane protein
VTAASVAVNLLAYLVPVLAARRLGADDLGALATSLALVAIATMPGVGLQTAVAVRAARPGWDGGGAARPALITAAICGGVVALASPVLSGALRLPPALPLLLAAMTAPAVLSGWPLGVLQGGERFGRLAAGMVLLAVGRYAGVLAGLSAGAGLAGSVGLGAVVAWSVPPLLLWLARRPDRGEAASPSPLRGRAVFTAVGASLSILVASYADLILARRLLPPGSSGAYAVGAVLTRAAIWAPQVVTLLALPRLARGRPAALRAGLALLGLAGVGMVAAAAIAGVPVMRAVGGRQYAGLGHLAPWFVAAGGLYAVTYFLLNAQLAAGARWPSAGLWAVVAGLSAVAALLRPATVGQLLACSVGAAAAGVLVTGAAVWLRLRSEVTAAR